MRCANPGCRVESLYFRGGSLNWVEVIDPNDPFTAEGVTQKLIWLCPECSSQFEVQTWRPPGQQIRRRNNGCAAGGNSAGKKVQPINQSREYAKAS